MRRNTVQRSVISAVILSLLAGGIGSANADQGPEPAAIGSKLLIPGMPDSRLLSGPIASTGKIVQAGRSLSGVAVTAYAWPANEAIDAIPAGEQIPLTPIAQTTTDANGEYDLVVPMGVDTYENENSDGSLNITLIASSETGVERASQVIEKPAGCGGTASLARGSQALAAAMRCGGGFYVPTEGSSSGETMEIAPDDPEIIPAAARTAGLAAAPEYPPGKNTCYTPVPFSTGITSHNTKAIVGQTFSNTAYVQPTFTYTTGAASELGIAVSVNGSSWAATGGEVRSINNENITTFTPPKGSGKYFFKTSFTAIKIAWKCHDNWVDRWNLMGYEVRPTTHWGGAEIQKTTTISNATQCARYDKGTSFTENRSKAMNWSNGFSISSPLASVSVGTQTGHSTASSISYTPTTKAIKVCGLNYGPAEHKAALFAARPI